MEERGWIARHGLWPLAFLWLPAGIAAQAAVRFLPDAGPAGDPHFWPAAQTAARSLFLVAPCREAMRGCRPGASDGPWRGARHCAERNIVGKGR